MAVPAGNFVGLNLGPRFDGLGSHVPLNLGVDWNVDPPDPPDPVIRGIRAGASMPWRGLAAATRRTVASGWQEAPRLRRAVALPWGKPSPIARAAMLAWGAAPKAKRDLGMAWHGKMPRLQRSGFVPWTTRPTARASATLPWRQQALLHAAERAIAWQGRPAHARLSAAMAWRGLLPRAARSLVAPWRNPKAKRWQRWIPWGLARRVPWIVLPPRPPKPPPPSGWTPADGRYVELNLGCAVIDVPGLAPLNLGMDACYLVRAHRRTYIVHNTVAVVRLPDETPIEVLEISLAGGADAWGWSIEMTLADDAALALLMPNADGPRPVRITLNGYVWTGIIESHQRTRELGNRSVRVSGRSRTALLAGPYAPARNKVSTEERSAAQLIDEELASTGYAADYATVDWLVPAGAWFYDATTPLDAIARIAGASGAVVQSDPVDLELRILPRYPVSPWDWPDSTPDHVVPDDLVTIESVQVRSAPLYNVVIVTGELEGKGVTAKVARAGEGQDLYAPQVSDALINTDTVAIERGRNVVSDRGEQAAIDLTLPMFPAPLAGGHVGRILPLQLVQVQAAEGTWHGLCTGVRIDVRTDGNAVVIEQTVTLERHFSDAN